MKQVELKRAKSFKGEIIPPPDKSISHRAVMLGALAKGKSRVRNFLMAEDPISTMNAFRSLAIEIIEQQSGSAEAQKSRTQDCPTFQIQKFSATELTIYGKGLYGLKEPFDVIDCGNSGTTARLISGILSGSPFFSVLTGDDSLRQRPMARVINPLKEMGADISARNGDKYLPMSIKGRSLKALVHKMPIASAQVKSCLILAGLYAEGTTIITEMQKSRDHTERMLKSMGADIETDGLLIKVKGRSNEELAPLDITVPSDFSSAAFFIAAALIIQDSEILIKNVGINPTRTGLLDVLKSMGADIKIENMRDASGEPVADIYCKSADSLKAVEIGADIMPSLIDEFPILCVLATQADGVTKIRGAEELRVKESDRIKAMASELKKLGVELEEYQDGISIKGKASLKGAVVESYNDHRIAMSLAIAALIAEGTMSINNPSCVDISFPGFFEELKKLVR